MNECKPVCQGKKGFPSSELLIWPHKRPPHWDYLVICSPNFYEVAFPCVFFFSFNFFHAFVLLRFGGCGLPSEGFIELRACPPLCHEMVEFQAKPRLIFCTRRKETVVAFLASQYF